MPLTLNAGAGGGDLATQPIAAEHFQEIKVILGADGVNDGGVSDANPMPIDDAGGSITVDGTVAVTGVATAANQTTEITSLQLLDDVVFAEDVGATAADKGIQVLAVRRDADTTLVGATNDYAPLQVDANGYLKVEIFDGGDSLTVDGTVTANLGATDNAVLDAIAASVAGATPAGTNNIGDVDVLTLPALVAGSANIGDVDVLSVVPGTAATNLGKAIDSAVGATDTGVAILAQRDDALGALTPAEGDYVPLRVNSTGALHVTGGGGGTEFNVDSAVGATPAGSLALVVRKDAATSLANADGDATALQVDTAGALRVTGGGGGTEYVVNAAAPADPTGATFVMERDDALSALTEVEGDWTNPRSNADGALWVAVETSALPTGAATAAKQDTEAGILGTIDADTGGILTAAQIMDDWDETDRAKVNIIAGQVGVAGGTGTDSALTQRVTLATNVALPAGTNEIGKLAAGTANIGDVDVLTLPALVAGTANIGDVDVLTLPALVAGTANIGDVDVLTVNAQAAHDAAIAGTPVTSGGVAINMDDTAPPNRVSAEADSVRQGMDWDGTLFAHPHGPQVWSYHSDGSSALTDASVHAAPSAGTSLYVTDVVVSTGAATAMNVFFEEGASKVLGPYYLEAVAGRGLALHFQTPKKITAATALTVTTSAAIAQSVDVTGFTAQG